MTEEPKVTAPTSSTGSPATGARRAAANRDQNRPAEAGVHGPADRRIDSPAALDGLRFGEPEGLIPVVAQDHGTGQVLMMAYASRESLERTLTTGEMHYWSRSRGEIWRKGATSGNVQDLVALHADCDGDTLLALVSPRGPACHTGDPTCFGRGAEPRDVLTELWQVLERRSRERPEGSYTARLLDDENLRVKKLGEEIAELLVALTRGAPERVTEEAADLVYHLLVALLASGSSLAQLRKALERRRG